jgi:hypothetical protein
MGLFSIAVYHIETTEDNVRFDGLVYGPAAIPCVPIGIFIDGIFGVYSTDLVFDQLWK